MAKAAVAAAIVIVLAFVFLFAPVVPFTFSSASYFGVASEQYTAQVSPSFVMFHCGMIANPTRTGTFFGYQGSSTNATTGFYCGPMTK
jgi:hypothetical protein